MTEDTTREPTVIRGAKLYFEGTRRYPADPPTLARYEMSAKIAATYYEMWLDANFNLRVMSICGYNPQKLLPAPTFEREMLQSISEWAAEAMKMPYTEFAQSVFKTLIEDGEVTFSPTGRYVDPRRYPEPIYTLVGETPVLLAVGADYTEVERKVLNYMYATFIHESAGGSPTPRGRIEIFDYEDRVLINLEGEGEIPGLIDESFYLKARNPARYTGPKSVIVPIDKPTKQNGRSASYLQHDPTKKHGRRRRGK